MGRYVCFCFPPYIPNHSRMSFSQVHSSIHHTLNPWLSGFLSAYVYQTPLLSFPAVFYSLSLSGIRGLKLLSLWPTTSQGTSSLSLTFRVRAALGKRQRTDLPIQGTVELRRGQQGFTLLHYPTNWACTVG